MKRIISIMLAVMMLLGLSFSAAEEAPASTSFPRALLDWVQSLNLDTSDYAGSVRWVNSPLYEGTIRKNQGITELAVHSAENMVEHPNCGFRPGQSADLRSEDHAGIRR